MLLPANYPDDSSPRYELPGSILLTLAIAVLDVAHYGTNSAILFSIPLLISARLGNRRLLVGLAIGMICLVYADYYLKIEIWKNLSSRLQHHSLVNRTLVSTALVGMTLVLYF